MLIRRWLSTDRVLSTELTHKGAAPAVANASSTATGGPSGSAFAVLKAFGQEYRLQRCTTMDASETMRARLRNFYKADIEVHRRACIPGRLHGQLDRIVAQYCGTTSAATATGTPVALRI